MRLGAFFVAATTLATGNPWVGLGAGALAGAAAALVHGTKRAHRGSPEPRERRGVPEAS